MSRILEVVTVILTSVIILIQVGADTQFNPLKRRSREGLGKLTSMRPVHFEFNHLPEDIDYQYSVDRVGILSEGDRGFSIIKRAISRHYDFKSSPTHFAMIEGKLPGDINGKLHSSPSTVVPINPNAALLAYYNFDPKDNFSEVNEKSLSEIFENSKIDADVLIYRPSDPFATLELRLLRSWVREEILRISQSIVIPLLLIWTFISIRFIFV